MSEPPFHALVSNSKKPTWRECAVAFKAFYESLLDGASLEDSVAAMRELSGNQHFSVDYGKNIIVPFNALMHRIRRKEIGDQETADRLYKRYSPLFEARIRDD